MLTKVFLLTQFGPPHPWSANYVADLGRQAAYGFFWKILTPHHYPHLPPNVELVPMTLYDFNDRVRRATDVETGNFCGPDGLPVKLTSDYYPAFGEICADLLHGADYWSVTNWDVVFGRLDHFLPDADLLKYDLWSDDCGHINSLCCFYRNVPAVNRLYRQVPDWPRHFVYDGLPLHGFDELYFDRLVRSLATAGAIRFGHPPYFAYHSYDRLIQHQPVPNLARMPDGALIECFEDDAPQLAHYPPWRGYFGREIMYFHFVQSKRWPALRPSNQRAA